ncbi:MAG: hypothetical protein QW238_06345 [Candidatus Bathyarchaeia archaeon]
MLTERFQAELHWVYGRLFEVIPTSYLEVRMEERDEATAASVKHVRIRGLSFTTPEKIPSSPEISSFKGLRLGPMGEGLGGAVVAERLVYPDTLRRLTSDDRFFKGFIRRIAGEVSGDEDLLIVYLCFKGGASVEDELQLRTLLDLQFLAGADLITVQQLYGSSWREFRSSLSYAEGWRVERGVEAPLMPVLNMDDLDGLADGIRELKDKGYRALGLDLRGSFPYMALRALEGLSGFLEDVWVHGFQTPPKVRLGRGFHACAEGMILPSFGVDTFSRWITPPPPEPLTKDKINVFDRLGWGFMKRGEWVKYRGSSMGCDCTVCKGGDLDSFFEGAVMAALRRGKVHDHLAQSSELRSVRESVKGDGFHKLLREKEFPKRLLSHLERHPG